MYTILHNSRCGKSRDAIKLLEDKAIDFQVIEYLKDELTAKELESVIKDLDLKPLDIIRTNEAIWKEQFKGKEYSDEELINIMVENPKLIQRPIILFNNKGVIGRPIEQLENFIETNRK